MAVPKKRNSKRRSRLRRSHNRLQPPALGRCSRCGAPTRPHAVCEACGYYKGTAVLVEQPAGATPA